MKAPPVPSERFDACALFLTSFWCDTLTEHECRQFFTVLSGLVLDARKQVQKWQKPRKVRGSISKTTKMVDTWKQVDHLDELGRRKPKVEKPRSGRRASAASGPGSPKSGGSPKAGERQASVVHPEDDGIDDRERELRERMRQLEKQKKEDERQQAKERRKSSAAAKRGSISGSGSARRASKKSNKTPIQLAEDAVKSHFEREEMDYQKLLQYIKLNYGGLESKPRDLLNMDEVMLEMLLVRIYDTEYREKHKRVKDPLKEALAAYFEMLRPIETRKELQGEQIGKYELPEGMCKEIMAWCQTNPLKKCAVLCKRLTQIAEPVIAERLRVAHPDPGWDSFESQLRGPVFSEDHCIALRQQIGSGKLKRPAGMARVIADMTCAVLGVDNPNGYWQPFKETICSRTSHLLFHEFDFRQMSAERFHLCARIKRNSDAGIVSGTAGEKTKQVQAHLIVTITDESVEKNVTPEMAALYRWIRLLMEYFGRYAGKTSHQDKYGWDTRPDFEIYWT